MDKGRKINSGNHHTYILYLGIYIWLMLFSVYTLSPSVISALGMPPVEWADGLDHEPQAEEKEGDLQKDVDFHYSHTTGQSMHAFEGA